MQLLQGVHYMHVNKIIHRDLKSSNILIGRKGELKIADWGLARSWNKNMKKIDKILSISYGIAHQSCYLAVRSTRLKLTCGLLDASLLKCFSALGY